MAEQGVHVETHTETWTSGGPWKNITRGYLGLKFFIQGKAHYGWARLNVTIIPGGGGIYGLLTGYAYETIANKTILAGKTKGDENEIDSSPADLSNDVPNPLTLGRLARGAAELATSRK
jgi:hypothetical protein